MRNTLLRAKNWAKWIQTELVWKKIACYGRLSIQGSFLHCWNWFHTSMSFSRCFSYIWILPLRLYRYLWKWNVTQGGICYFQIGVIIAVACFVHDQTWGKTQIQHSPYTVKESYFGLEDNQCVLFSTYAIILNLTKRQAMFRI